MKKKSILESFLKRIQRQRDLIQNRINQYSILRLILFFLLVTGVSLSFDGDWVVIARFGSLGLFIFFMWILKKHDQLFQKLKIRQELIRQVENDLARLDGDFERLPLELPDQLFPLSHPFAHDLDFLAANSIFKLFGELFHDAARKRVVSWFDFQGNIDGICARQEAIRELARNPKLRRHFLAFNRLHSHSEWSTDDLKAWVSMPVPRFMNLQFFFGLIVAALSTGCLFASFFFGIATPWAWFLGLQLTFFLVSASYLKPFILAFLSASPIIRTCGRNLFSFAKQNWAGQVLQDLKTQIGMEREELNSRVNSAEAIHQALSTRKNGLSFLTLNLLFQWDVIYCFRLVKWKKKLDKRVLAWVEVMIEIESLSSLAHFSYLFPQFPFPQLTSGSELFFQAENLGHPCIPHDQRVCNDYEIIGNGHMHLLTGSNMSGKSTFLRTVGLNWVLALAGAPCCASRLSCSNSPVWTSMRIQDSLAQGTSYFYAEVKRLKAILDSVLEVERKIFYLLDEILKGTNSHERFLATAALAEFLHNRGSSGVISTHDLGLLQLAEQGGAFIENFHFSEVISQQKMSFDYKLKKGQLTSTNALRIIELAGLPLRFDS